MASRQATGRTAELALVRLDRLSGLDRSALELVLQVVGGPEGRVVLVLPGGWDRHGGVERVIDGDESLVEQARAAVQRLGDDHGLLDEAWSLAECWADDRRMVQVACARAEAAWIGGRTAELRSEAHRGWQLASERSDAWALGELAWWLSLAGGRPVSPVPVAAPFRHMLDGDWRAAAEAWHRNGRTLWAAYALGCSPSLADVRRAVGIGEAAGATAAVRAILRDRRANGLPVPPQPRSATRANPLQLTRRGDGGPRPARRRAHQPPDRDPAVPVRTDGRPPRVRRTAEARSAQPLGGGRRRSPAGHPSRRAISLIRRASSDAASWRCRR